MTVALPVFPPLQRTEVDEAVAVRTGGWVMVVDAVVVQPFASVTVTVYEPAVNAVPVAVFPPEGVQA